ncbi:cysteine-rich secretory family protein [Modicisalibacter xianhensis]|uniref:Cysteine-rich secretory family protein n=1 Tax=Modicisalibacter xianhensis TaxID=442341 RepID=A0A4R8FV23_9GAMM|nr:cysteine-rich secretory family protein [Halomonas xianhensis]
MKNSGADVVRTCSAPWALAGLLGLLSFSGAWASEGMAGDAASERDTCELTEPKREMLSRINEARGQSRQCGDERFAAVEPLTWNCTLEAAAEAHSLDMAKNDYFSHTGPDGVGIQQRVSSRDYVWRAVGENIAAGQASIAAVVEGWLDSPGHCSNIMNSAFTEMGMARADDPGSMYSPYWTQVLAQPR